MSSDFLFNISELYSSRTKQYGIKVPRPEKGRTPLSRFLLTSLKDKPKSVTMLKQEVLDAGLLKDSKYPSRAVHFALVGMKRGNLVEKTNGIWKLNEQSGEGI